MFAHSHPILHRRPSASLVLGSFTSIFSFVSLTLGQRGLKLYYYLYGTDKETEVQNGALTNPKPHGERVRDRDGTQTPDAQFRVHSPTLLWICLSPLPDLESLFLFLPGLSLSNSEHKGLPFFPKPQGDRKSLERLLGAGPRRKNLGVFSPIFLKYGVIILQDPPGEKGPD